MKEQPKFHHQEINALYCNGLNIEKEKLDAILNLPRQTLIQDLELVLEDSITRYSYFNNIFEDQGWNEDEMSFVIHAIFILGELRASESISSIFNVLSQSEDYLELYLEDFLIESLCEPIFKMATNNLQEMKEFMFKPSIDVYAQANIPDVVAQIALHYPDRREEVVNWFSDLIDFFLNSSSDEDLITFAICNIVQFSGIELLPKIEKLFEKELVDTDVCGSLTDVKNDMNRSLNANKKNNVLSIFERYDNIISTWAGYREENLLDELEYAKELNSLLATTVVRTEPKIGRNDPCPCGSGKKYKKCCLNK